MKLVIEKRDQTTPLSTFLGIVVAIIIACVISALLILTSGSDISVAISSLYRGAFGSMNAFKETLVQSTPLLMISLAIVVAFRGRVWNIGAEGQFFAGAIAAAWVSMNYADLPRPLLLFLILLAAAIAGGIWGILPGVLKAYWGVSEIIVTVMMNYIIKYVLSYLLSNAWTDVGDFFMQSPRFAESTWLPTFFNSRLHLGFFLALFLSVFIYILIDKTPFGYALRSIGDNPTAARYKGINIKLIVVLAMVISGAIAGLAGGAELNGLNHRLRLDISNNYGFTAILVALLGRLNPFGVIIASIAFGALVNGSTAMQIFADVPVALVFCVQGIVLFCVLAIEPLTYYQIRRVPK